MKKIAIIGLAVLTSIISQSGEAAVSMRPAMRGCPSTGFLRLVKVSSDSQLSSALSAAQAGDQIRLAAGTYSSGRTMSRSGTSNAAITICGERGVWPIIKGGTFKLQANYLNITGLVFEGGGNNNNVGIMSSRDILFTYNEVRNGFWHAGIAVDSTANVEISHNYIHDIGLTDIDHGIYFRYQTGKNLIANNLITRNRGRGISMHDNSGYAINGATVVHNTIVRNGSTGLLLAVNLGTGNVVANNIFSDNGFEEGYKQIRVIAGSSGQTAGGNSVMNNIVWSPDVRRQGIEVSASGNALSQNLSVDPKFFSSSDYHLQSSSPAIGLALASYTVSVDRDDRLRDSSPDSGGYEYGGVSIVQPTPTPVPTTTPVPTPVPTATPIAMPYPPVSGANFKRFASDADALTSARSMSANYGSKNSLAVDGENKTESKRTYLKFTVSSISLVKKATLRLYVTAKGSSQDGPAVYLTSNSWSESSINWSNQPNVTGGLLSDKLSLPAASYVEYDVTAAIAGNGTYSFALIATSDDSAFFGSRESDNKPELLIEY